MNDENLPFPAACESAEEIISYILDTPDEELNAARICFLAEMMFDAESRELERLAFYLISAVSYRRSIRRIFPKFEH